MMTNKKTINAHEFYKTQIDCNEYQVSVFLNDKFNFQFNVSLQPAGKDNVFPTYQLSSTSKLIPLWTRQSLNVISDWIRKETK